MVEWKKGERKLSLTGGLALFFGVFLAIIDCVVVVVSAVLLSIGQTFRWEMLLLAGGCLLAALLAWLIIRAGVKRYRLLEELRRYCRLLGGNPSGDIRQIAQLMGKTPEQVEQELEKLLRLNCFPPEVYLDKDSRRLHVPASRIAVRPVGTAGQGPVAPSEPEEFVLVVCSQCGTVNRVPKGKTMKCQGPGCKAQLSGQAAPGGITRMFHGE